MCIFDIQTMKILIFHQFSVYFMHSKTPSGTAGWAWLGCLGGLGGRSRPGASEEQKTLKNLAKMVRNFPALYVFLYFLDLKNAKCSFFQRKCVRHFARHPPTQPPCAWLRGWYRTCPVTHRPVTHRPVTSGFVSRPELKATRRRATVRPRRPPRPGVHAWRSGGGMRTPAGPSPTRARRRRWTRGRA